jgi:hypothetical protein
LNLNQPDLLARDGLTPSDGDPHFHQQMVYMVYAVSMRTIRTFERALGRLAHWPQQQVNCYPRKVKYERRLKLRPHHMPDANAYFDPASGSLCFGYFLSAPDTKAPGTQIFTCLSQDVIAHEVTHALLLGMKTLFVREVRPIRN